MDGLPLANRKVHLSVEMLHEEALTVIHGTLASARAFSFEKARDLKELVQTMEYKRRTNRWKLVCGYD